MFLKIEAGILYYNLSPLSPFLIFLGLKSLAHFAPQNIRDMLTDDTKKKKKTERKKEMPIDSLDFSREKANSTLQFLAGSRGHPGAGI